MKKLSLFILFAIYLFSFTLNTFAADLSFSKSTIESISDLSFKIRFIKYLSDYYWARTNFDMNTGRLIITEVGRDTPPSSSQQPTVFNGTGFYLGSLTITRDDTGTVSVPLTGESMNIISQVGNTIILTNSFFTSFAEGFEDLRMVVLITPGSSGNITFGGKGNNGSVTLSISGVGTLINNALRGNISIKNNRGLGVEMTISGSAISISASSAKNLEEKDITTLQDGEDKEPVNQYGYNLGRFMAK